MPETVKRLDTFEKLLKECSNIQETDSLNSDEIMDKIISKADTACTKYTEEVECDSPYFSFFYNNGSTRREQVNQLQSDLNNVEISKQEKVKKIIDTFCKLKRRYRANNSYFKSRFLEQLTIHPINYLLQVVSCRYIYDERINENYSFREILKQLDFPDELCLHFSALESAQHRNFTGAQYVCGLPIVNVKNEGEASMKKSLRTPKNIMSIDDLESYLRYNELSPDNQEKVNTLIIAYKNFVSEPTKKEKVERIEKDKNLLLTSNHTPQANI